tara:strand:+ start:176 stop:1291 length:1116 start_codon:yes stop_codon:yes gene_type:complete
MRIGYIFNSSLPSSNPGSLQVIKTCEALMKHNNQVDLITPNTGLNLTIKKFYNLKKIPTVHKLKFFRKFPIGVNYYLFSIFAALYSIKFKFDIIITRNPFTLLVLCLLKKKVIIEFHHDFSVESRIVRFLFYKFKILKNKNIIKIVAITENVKQFLIKDFKIDKNRIEVIASATDLEFKFVKLKNKKNLNIGYFGSLEQGKGADFVCKLSKLDTKNNYFVYGGSVEKVKKIKKNFNNINLTINSYKPYGELSKYISDMDILLMPSSKKIIKATGGVGNLSKFTSPLKLFDYLASGKLIISSKLNVLNDIIKNNVNCIMIENLKLINWLKEINYIFLNLKKINRLKKSAFDLSKKYTYYKRAGAILKNIKVD